VYLATLAFAPWSVRRQTISVLPENSRTEHFYRYEPIWSGPEFGEVTLRWDVLAAWWTAIAVISGGVILVIRPSTHPA
jgi:hypothetical protein